MQQTTKLLLMVITFFCLIMMMITASPQKKLGSNCKRSQTQTVEKARNESISKTLSLCAKGFWIVTPHLIPSK